MCQQTLIWLVGSRLVICAAHVLFYSLSLLTRSLRTFFPTTTSAVTFILGRQVGRWYFVQPHLSAQQQPAISPPHKPAESTTPPHPTHSRTSNSPKKTQNPLLHRNSNAWRATRGKRTLVGDCNSMACLYISSLRPRSRRRMCFIFVRVLGLRKGI